MALSDTSQREMGEDEVIGDVVRAFVESLGEPSASTRWVTFLSGKLREHAELVASEAAPGGLEEEATVHVERLAVEPGSGEERSVDLDAIRSWTVKAAGRPRASGFARLSGPVRVLRTERGWKIVDYVRDGRSRVASLVLGPTAWVAADDVRARVLAVDVGGRTTDVDLEFDNRSHYDLYFGRPWFARRLAGPLWRFFPARGGGARQEVAAGETIRTHLSIGRAFALPPTELRLFVPLVRFESKRWTGLDFRLALAERVEDAGSTTSGSMALPTGLRAQIWAIRLAVVALVVGVVSWWLFASA